MEDRQQGSIRRAAVVLLVSLQLGLTSFGGPIAHLGYFQRVYVERRRWLTSEDYASLVALAQAIPGPASSQVGFLIGWRRAGWLGGLAGWLGFTFPSALLMYACAVLSPHWNGPVAAAVTHGLQLVAVAVVAQALLSMARRLCPDGPTRSIALACAVLPLLAGGARTQFATLLIGALAGIAWCRPTGRDAASTAIPIPAATAWAALALFTLLLVGLPTLASESPRGIAALADVYYRAGALVFGGGHVVLPLLRDTLVPGGWLSDDRFLAGYGMAQAMPGPLFSVAAYLGAASHATQPAALAGMVAVVSIFLPGLLLALAGAALFGRVMHRRRVVAALAGINAAVVGILGAALYDPVWTTAIHGRADALVAATGLLLLERFRTPAIAIVALCVAFTGAAALLKP